MHAAAPAGHVLSISDLLADVRRIKLAGESLRAVCSRPATAAPQGRAAASSPSQELHTITGPRVGAAGQVDKQCSQESPPSDGSHSDHSSDDCLGSHRSRGQSARSITDDSSISQDQLPGLTR